MGIGPTQSAWKADVLPLNYTRIYEKPDIRDRIPIKEAAFSDTYNSSVIAGLWLWSPALVSGLRIGAGYEIRTRDFHLGKVTLYH